METALVLAGTVPALAEMVPVLAETVPALAETAPALAETAPVLVGTVPAQVPAQVLAPALDLGQEVAEAVRALTSACPRSRSCSQRYCCLSLRYTYKYSCSCVLSDSFV